MMQKIDIVSLNVVKCYSQEVPIVLMFIFNFVYELLHPHAPLSHPSATVYELCFLQKYHQGNRV